MSERPAWWSTLHAAERAWSESQFDKARDLIRVQLEHLEHLPDADHSTYAFLDVLAKVEARAGDRDAFELASSRIFSLHPDAPFPHLVYARTLWEEFRDTAACERAIARLEGILDSGQWNPDEDFSRKAYDGKIATLRAWLVGKPGGPLWP